MFLLKTVTYPAHGRDYQTTNSDIVVTTIYTSHQNTVFSTTFFCVRLCGVRVVIRGDVAPHQPPQSLVVGVDASFRKSHTTLAYSRVSLTPPLSDMPNTKVRQSHGESQGRPHLHKTLTSPHHHQLTHSQLPSNQMHGTNRSHDKEVEQHLIRTQCPL